MQIANELRKVAQRLNKQAACEVPRHSASRPFTLSQIGTLNITFMLYGVPSSILFSDCRYTDFVTNVIMLGVGIHNVVALLISLTFEAKFSTRTKMIKLLLRPDAPTK